MGKKRRQQSGHSSDSSVSSDSTKSSPNHGRSITKVLLKKTHSVSSGLNVDVVVDDSVPASDGSLPVGTKSLEVIATKTESADILDEKDATFAKDDSKSSAHIARRLSPSLSMNVMTIQHDMLPSFNIYETRKDFDGKISPVIDRKPSLCGDEYQDKDTHDTNMLTPDFVRSASRSGSGDFGAIIPLESPVEVSELLLHIRALNAFVGVMNAATSQK